MGCERGATARTHDITQHESDTWTTASNDDKKNDTRKLHSDDHQDSHRNMALRKVWKNDVRIKSQLSGQACLCFETFLFNIDSTRTQQLICVSKTIKAEAEHYMMKMEDTEYERAMRKGTELISGPNMDLSTTLLDRPSSVSRAYHTPGSIWGPDGPDSRSKIETSRKTWPNYFRNSVRQPKNCNISALRAQIMKRDRRACNKRFKLT